MTSHEPWREKVELFRKRFGSRTDAFCVRNVYTKTVIDDGTPRLEEVATFSPQCENFGKADLCHITQRRGGCSTCENKKYQPLTDEWVWKHISGQKELVLYLLQDNGIKFGACDFDYGTHFEDAKKTRDCSLSLGLPCYIARSSRKGYHLYWFFSSVLDPELFINVIHHIYDKVGFVSRYRESGITLPETFPKQTRFEAGKVGNGIKVPMIEPKMRDGFNCWVDDSAIPVPFGKQWEYLESCKEITPEQINKAIETHNIRIIRVPTGKSGTVKSFVDQNAEKSDAPVKPKGDFWKIVENCPALKQFWEKDVDGLYKFDKTANEHGVPHDARVASLAFARATENGLEILNGRWKTSRTSKELTYATSSNQHPWTCRAMQDKGLCRPGLHPIHRDYCIKKTPPGDITNGVYQVNPDNLPESEWKEPSPYRFATGFMTFDQIQKALSDLFDFRNKKVTVRDNEGNTQDLPAPPPRNLDDQVYELIKKSKKLPQEEEKKVSDYVALNKIMPSKEFKELEKRINKEVREERYQEKKSTIPSFTFGKNDFLWKDGRYYKAYIDAKGIRQEVDITNFAVEIKEEHFEYESTDDESKLDQRPSQCWFKGIIHVNKKRLPFKCPANDWIKNAEVFFTLLTNHAGGDLLYNKADFDAIRNCVNNFSEAGKVVRKRIQDFGYHKIRGEDNYVTPSVIVTKDAIKPNTELELEFRDETSRPLDFKIIDDAHFKDLAQHIITDYFNCNTPLATMTLFSHAMAASIISHIPLKKSPMLWIDGSFSGGKSFIAEVAQCFYGNFEYTTGMQGTGKSKLGVSHNYRHALLVIDDFKGSLNDKNDREMVQFIHTAYDRSGRTALQRDGKLRETATRTRGLIATTGEDCPAHEASATSRMLLVNVGSKSKNVFHGERVKLRKSEYCGFTPHFIQFVYNMSESEIAQLYNEYLKLFSKVDSTENNDCNHRIAENLAFNMTAFRIATELLLAKGVIPAQRKEEFCAQHIKNLEIIRTNVTANVSAQKGSALFLEAVRELLQDPARYHISNWGTFDPTEHRNSKSIGFWRDKNPDLVFLYPGVVHGEVETFLNKGKSYSQTRHHIARQLYEDGHIPAGMYDVRNSSFMKQVLTPVGNRTYCWGIRLESLGFEPPKPTRKLSLVDNTDDRMVNFAVDEQRRPSEDGST